jgi:CRISPR-associated endonuclease Csn1
MCQDVFSLFRGKTTTEKENHMKKDIGPYKLSLDLGSTSVGWAVLKIQEHEANSQHKGGNHEVLALEALGVRIYDDGRDAKTKEPLAVSRRMARGARRNRDRKKKRVSRLMNTLIEQDLFPSSPDEQKELQNKNPYEIRDRALKETVSPHEMGRGLLHIAQRRGFKSNRKTDSKDNESTPLKEAIAKLDKNMMAEGASTLGQYLHNLKKGQPKRIRKTRNTQSQESEQKKNNKEEYSFFTSRDMYEREVDALLKSQERFSSHDKSRAYANAKDIIFHQRNLRPVEVGFCTFEYETKERRAPLALPVVQEFRIYQELANLDFRTYKKDELHLTKEQKNIIAQELFKKNKVSFKHMRKVLKIDGDLPFNLESDNRKELDGHHTHVLLAHEKAFGKEWYNFSGEDQQRIVLRILEEENEDILVSEFQAEFALEEEKARHIANLSLKDGYGRLSEKAIRKILPHLKEGCVYSEACTRAGYDHHSDFRTGEIKEQLPYYGEALPHRVIGGKPTSENEQFPEKFYGKINNPTVHIVLNQIRKLVNACIDEWGHPDAISIELARDLKEHPSELNKANAKNKRDNERIDAELSKLGVSQPKRDDRLRFKLWEETSSEPSSRCCPFSGKTIGFHEILSPAFEIEHLVPYSVCYDDGKGNKVLACKQANQFKGNKTPHEAFSHSPPGYKWNEILARVDAFKSNFKKSRFMEDARERFANQDDVIARQLNDTRYLSRMAKEYLQFICDPDKITPIPGQLTAMMRQKWGLEGEGIWGKRDDGTEIVKNRDDHRHHALDAFVVGCTTRSILQKVATEANNIENNPARREQRKKLVDKMPDPYPGFLQNVKDHFSKMIISHKPDIGSARKATQKGTTISQLHEETAYGLITRPDTNEKVYVVRKAVEDLEKKDIEKIVDENIRSELQYALHGAEGKEVKEIIREYLGNRKTKKGEKAPPIHRLRMIGKTEEQGKSLVPIKDKSGKTYKYYQGGNNAYTEIFVSEEKDVKDPETGKVLYKKGQWYAETVRQYEAHQEKEARKWISQAPMAKKIMRLHKNDMVAYEKDGKTIIARVKKMSDGKVWLIPHTIVKEEKPNGRTWEASAKQMQRKNLRKIRVDILGRVYDPGPYPYKKKTSEESS